MLTYLALGDSYTIGEKVPFLENFPNQTVARLRQQKMKISDPLIIATTGWTTDELQAAIREKGLCETFSLVSLLIGVNNQYRGRSLENYEQEFTQLLIQSIHFANGHSDKVFILSIPDWGVTPFAEGKDRIQIAQEIDAYNTVAKKITQAHKCHFLEITNSTRINGIHEDYWTEDQLHPSAKEYAIWAERLAAMVLAAQ
ncbi:MAG: SGNH/GDSL hydrolase family protein [Phycisphaerales bacterium]|nr:SGNH/GDSL hydrolase family protein [Phycisphaerales bacterium]